MSSRRTSTKKHEKMAEDAFQFLRATYWRWAETIYDVCRDLKDAPPVLAVGDIHRGEFRHLARRRRTAGLGRERFRRGREDALRDRYRAARDQRRAREVPGIANADICDSILEGYAKGLNAPAPFVLDREHEWLRDVVVVSDKERKKFWEKFDPRGSPRNKPDKVDRRSRRTNCRAATRRRSSARGPSRSRAGILFARRPAPAASAGRASSASARGRAT